MAILYSNNNSFLTTGEEYIYKNILSSLTDDWHVFYEPLIIDKKPDFIIFHPNYGITIIEVKDYNKNSIIEMNHKYWKINANGKIKTLKSPIEQAVGYRNNLINLLSKDSDLHSRFSNYKGKLRVPVSILCCFPNISRSEQLYEFMNKFIPENILTVKEDINSTEIFTKKILKSLEKLFPPEQISNEEKNKILNYIFPRYKSERSNDNINASNLESFIRSFPYRKFDNCVEEVIYVADVVSHLLNSRIAQEDRILIVYNKKRSVAPSTKEYLKLLMQLLHNKNIPNNLFEEKIGGVRLINYDELIKLIKLNKIQSLNIIMVDFNTVAFNLISDFILFITENSESYFSVLITSNEHIPT